MTRGLLFLVALTAVVPLASAADPEQPDSYVVHCEYVTDRLKIEFPNGSPVPKRLSLVLAGDTRATLDHEFTILATQLSPNAGSGDSASLSLRGWLRRRADGIVTATISATFEAHAPDFENDKRLRRRLQNQKLRLTLGEPMTFGRSSEAGAYDFFGKSRGLNLEFDFVMLTVEDEKIDSMQKRRWYSDPELYRERVVRESRNVWGRKLLEMVEDTHGVAETAVETAVLEFLRESDIDPCDIECSFLAGRLNQDEMHFATARKTNPNNLPIKRAPRLR